MEKKKRHQRLSIMRCIIESWRANEIDFCRDWVKREVSSIDSGQAKDGVREVRLVKSSIKRSIEKVEKC